MATKSQYNFREAELDQDFAKENIKDFRRLIDAGISFVVLSIPGVGVSYFLRYLAMQDFADFIHVDMYALPTLSQHEFYKLLLTELCGKPGSKTDEQLLAEAKKALQTLANKRAKIDVDYFRSTKDGAKIVIIFSRFDQLKNQFDWNLLSNIQSLTTIAPGKIVLIFTSTKPLYDIAPDALTGGNLNFYSEEVYFKPYSKQDLEKLCKIEASRSVPKLILEKLFDLSGGHNQLLGILLSSQKQQNLLLDRFVKLQMKELTDYLDYSQRKCLQRIALGKTVNEVDEYLLGVGMVKQVGSRFTLFTPLLTEYIKTNAPVKLPVKENRLFKLLRNNIGKTVTKDEIFREVWPARNASGAGGEDNSQEATDWALDALIYRLRKHPFMQANGYIIESHKKVGYTLIQP